jgi:hypothetical protein
MSKLTKRGVLKEKYCTQGSRVRSGVAVRKRWRHVRPAEMGQQAGAAKGAEPAINTVKRE